MRIGELAKELITPLRRGTSKRPARAWEQSARLAGHIVNPGPDVSRLKAEEVVAALREQSAEAEKHILKTTKLQPSLAHVQRYGDGLANVKIVDRGVWAHYAAKTMADLFGIDNATPVDGEPDPTDLNGVVETTAVLTFLSQKTLGQFVPNMTPAGAAHVAPADDVELQDDNAPELEPESPGYLLLVAPNVLLHQRAMAVDLKQFALWISLHEYTHALQFAAADWLPQYMRDCVSRVIRSFESESSLIEWGRALAESMRGRDSMIERLLNDSQRAELAKITSLMTVLEGHAEVIMDTIPAHVVPTRSALRRKFNARRKDTRRITSTVGRVSGLEQKAAQYETGAGFVSTVKRQIGLEGFNRVFISEQFIPTLAEIENPPMWIARTDALLEQRAEQSSTERAAL